MRSTISYFIRYPIWTNVIILIIVLLGIFSTINIKKRYFPAADPNRINIQVAYPGASPEELEEGVVIKIEEAIKGIEGIEEFTSTSSENSGSVVVNVLPGYNAELVLTEVKNAVDQINSFPVSAEKPVVYNAKPRLEAVDMIIVGETDLMALKKYAEGIKDDILMSDAISQAEITGFPAVEISIEVSEETLRRFDLTFDQLGNAIRLNNRDISSGSVKSENEEVLIRARSKRDDIDGIGNIIVRTNDDGSILRLREVAKAELRFADEPTKATYNGKNSVTINVVTLPDEDIVDAVDYVNAYTEKFNAENQLVQIVLENDRSDYLKQRLGILMDNGVLGLILVLFLLGLFLNLRLSFWVAFGIPFSFLGMVFVAHMIGITINVISLFGMILVIGILVDDGIIVGENIYSHFEKGKSPLQACIDGTMEVLPSVFTGVTTTIVAFCVFFFIEGRFGDIVMEMAAVVILCLAFSLLECAFILPPHLAHSGALKDKAKSKTRAALEKGLSIVRDRWYGSLLSGVMRYRYITFAFGAVCVMLTIGLVSGGWVGFGFFPFIDRDDMTFELVLKPGTREHTTLEHLYDIEEQIWAVNEKMKAERKDGRDVILSTRMDLGSSSADRGSHVGQIRMELLPGEIRDMASFEISRRIMKEMKPIPGAEKVGLGTSSRWGKPVSISLKSKDFAEMDAAKEFVKAELRNYSDLQEIVDTNIPGRRELNMELKPEAYLLGLTQNEITRQIRQGFFGEEVQRLQIGIDEVRVWLRYPPENRKSIGELEDMKIKMADGREYPLGDLVNYKVERGLVNIKHLDGAREVRVEADLVDRQAPVEPILASLEKKVMPVLQEKYSNVQVSFEGQSRRSNEISGSLFELIPMALLGIFLIIALSFRSFSQAELILLMIPLGFVGAIFGHLIHGKQMSIFSIYGMIALSGVIVNDAVVFADKFNRLLKDGHKLASAVFYAAKSRFRPIILTSLTTVIGLYPLILAKSRQAQWLIPMAISVAYGVLIGTIFILTIFPALLMVANDIRILWKWLKEWAWNANKQLPDRTEVEPAILETKRMENIL